MKIGSIVGVVFDSNCETLSGCPHQPHPTLVKDGPLWHIDQLYRCKFRKYRCTHYQFVNESSNVFNLSLLISFHSVCHSGMFGAGCTQTCHCAAGDCLPHSGECMLAHAGCASGWSGQNCQSEVLLKEFFFFCRKFPQFKVQSLYMNVTLLKSQVYL